MKHKHILIMNYPKQVKKNWHSSTVDELMDFFLTSKVTGLSSSEVFKRSQSLGTNTGGIISQTSSPFFKTACLRDKKRQTISIDNLVLGDIVFLEAGKMVPADIRMIEVKNLALDQSLLNGSNAPAYKHSLAGLSKNTDPIEYKNMAYAGSFVINGDAKGVVVGVGPHTQASELNISSQKPLGGWRITRKVKNFARLGIVIQNSDILKQLKHIDTVIINLPLQADDYKELIRVLHSRMKKNIIICNSNKSTQNLGHSVAGIVHLGKQQFIEQSNKALLESDHTIMFFDDVSQAEIIRYAKLLKLKNRSVLCIDSGEDSQLFQTGLITLAIASTAQDKSIFEADILIGDINDKQKFIKQIGSLLEA